jgi:phenylacetate-CoA ligase
MNAFYDALEQRSPDEREAALMTALPLQVAHAQAHSEAFAHILVGVDAHSITSRAALAQLPVTRKSELFERQQAERARHVSGGPNQVDR